MKHKHHIVPRHMGGSDSPENIVELTIEEHAQEHKKLYEKYGKVEDYIAWKGLEKSVDLEDIISLRCSLGGKKGAQTLKKLKKCSFYNDELRYEASKRGREVSKERGSGFYNSELQSSLGKRGGVKNKGFVWLNDGTDNIKYSPKMQKIKSIEDFLKENPNYSKGRIPTSKKVMCPHCKKEGLKCAMMLHHFDNCFHITGKKRSFVIEKTKCPHCGKIGAGGSMNRWHFNNCKFKKEF